jgi:hypothetical protein
MRTGTVPSLQTRYSVPAVKVLILPGISVAALSVAPAVTFFCVMWKPENPTGAMARATADMIVNVRHMVHAPSLVFDRREGDLLKVSLDVRHCNYELVPGNRTGC